MTASEHTLEVLARIGYTAKGVVYVIMGSMALLFVAHAGGDAGGSKTVFEGLLRQPFGRTLLGVMALGLTGYSLWRLAQATIDPENKGKKFKSIVLRIGFLGSAVVHGAWVFDAIQGALGHIDSREDGVRQWTRLAMYEGVWGRVLIALVGMTILGVAAYQYYLAFSGAYRKRINCGELGRVPSEVLLRAGQFGIIARAVVFTMMGGFLVQAAYMMWAGHAKGWADALRMLYRQPFGPWLLGVISVGLVCYGIYQFLKARYRAIC